MNAIDLLEKQHRLVADLFSQIEDAKTPAEKVKLFERLASNLVAHDAIEREIFYPACEKALGEHEDILGESLVEHGVIEFSIFRADKNRGKEKFDSYVTVLKEMVEHHVEEEEKELLPRMKRTLDKAVLDKLGARMEARFAEALGKDFRAPLVSNLQQVLAGRAKTAKSPPRTSRAPGKPRAAARTSRTSASGNKKPSRSKSSGRRAHA